jgi:hypothetical protein
MGDGNVQDLRALVMRLLGDVGGDWLGEANENRRPAADDAGASMDLCYARRSTRVDRIGSIV